MKTSKSTLRLKTLFGEQKGQIIADIIEGKRSPEDFASVQRWIAQCYHPPRKAELKLEAINEVLEGHGVEALRGRHVDNFHYDVQACYVNMGDTYAPTVLLDHEELRWHFTSWGDWIERYGEEREIQ